MRGVSGVLIWLEKRTKKNEKKEKSKQDSH
jgi:hypothetical protein